MDRPAALSITIPRQTIAQASNLDEQSPKTPDSCYRADDDADSVTRSLPSERSGPPLRPMKNGEERAEDRRVATMV